MTDIREESTEVRTFGKEKIEVIYRKTRPINESGGLFPELSPGVTLTDGIRYERDVAVPMRDGTTIYTDIYRPERATSLPSIVAWSPYGKRGGYSRGTPLPGVPSASPMTKFEGPDPAYWCQHGYAVINPDPRGVGNSRGDIAVFGTQEGRDIHDLIEWVAVRDWSSGKVGM